MLSGLLSVVFAFVALVGIGWIANELKARIPNRTTTALPTYGKKKFLAHGDVESFWINEFRIQFVTEWEIGHDFSITANGEVSMFGISDDESENPARLYLQFFPNEEPFVGSDQIGWCTIKDSEKHGKYVEGRLILRGSVIAGILGELRLSQRHYVRIRGVENDKGNLAITSFDLTPSR